MSALDLAARAPRAALDERLAALAEYDKHALVVAWRKAYQCEPPPRVRADFLRRAVAFAWQVEVLGYDPDLRRRLALLARGGKVAWRPPAGAQLVREWNGVSHSVSVLADGYEYAGQRWSSLSAIARAITGTRWSGPLFFGLKDRGVVEKPTGGRP
jgi:hypothetical protein